MDCVAYLTDVEGRWPKFADFLHDNPAVALRDGRLEVAVGCALVFGGDAVDRGPDALRIIELLTEAKLRQPAQVTLLAGNRDINKLRFLHEVAPRPDQRQPPKRTPPDLALGSAAPLVQFILRETMSAKVAFACRGEELAARGLAADDDAVAQSLVDDVRPGGLLLRYLELCELMAVRGDTLFVHGAVAESNWGVVPGREACDNLADWQCNLNEFFARSLQAARTGDVDGYLPLVRYQAPLPGQKLNPASVVYGRPTDAEFNVRLPDETVMAKLLGAGIRRLVVGHTPIGEVPCLASDGQFVCVFGDTSYSPLERGGMVLLDGPDTVLRGWSHSGGGGAVPVQLWHRSGDGGPRGMRARDGALVVGSRRDGQWATDRGMAGWQRSQQAVAAGPIAVAPWRQET